MSLFEDEPFETTSKPVETTEFAPLATRMRPRTLDEFAGQKHILNEDNPIRKSLEAGKLGSVILWGPAGCGKTTLANLIAQYANAAFEMRSAVTVGVSDIRKVADAAKARLKNGRRTLLFLDEIHGFSRSQQDTMLPYAEDGTLILVGATTENPFFVIGSALLSRARVLVLKPLQQEEIAELIERALNDTERGLGTLRLTINPAALTHLIYASNGDTRIALNALEAAAQLSKPGTEITVNSIESVLQQQAVRYDRKGDNHYDTISAFIKSLRGSDPDAALHYLAKMLAAGEDPRFICRRMIIFASEDVGNAEPMGLVLAMNASLAVERVGMPESNLILSQAVTFLATAPKSNASTVAIMRAQDDVKNKPIPQVPVHLRDSHYASALKIGHGEGYKYPHDFEDAWVEQFYVEPGFIASPYYEPVERGEEAEIKARMEKIAAKRKKK